MRRFNRFYARHAGALHERTTQEPLFANREVRILHELAHGRAHTAADLSRNLGLDTGYLSRLITSFQKASLVQRVKNEADGRANLLTMTAAAKAKVDEIDLHISAETATLLSRLTSGEIEQLTIWAWRTSNGFCRPAWATCRTHACAVRAAATSAG